MTRRDSEADPPARRRGAVSSASDDERLLAAAREAWTEGGSSMFSTPPSAHPDAIGRYRIVSVLGQGGMGVVYEAEQQDPRRPVALKVVRGGKFVDEHHIRLFQREAQTLARLRHPGIAAIYESGRTDDGRHFFAMELVRGEALNRYVDARRLSLRQRLELFRKVCDAINYAHQRGVIHRDLKPSNIIIDADENPKILDFGLAKMTDSDVATATVVTQLGNIQGTLAYMSPEQARGNPDEIDLRSDVYALGVILYELTTDRLPHQVEGSALHEAVRIVCEDEPVRPSRVRRSIPPDLETIILKAMAKEPSRRYHSAAALSEDIERFLTNQAILARPPSTIYQLQKLVARNKMPFVLVALLFVVVTAFGFWSLSMYRAEQGAHRLAKENAETAREVTDFLVESFSLADPNVESADTVTAVAILDRGAARIRSDLRDKPIVQATLMVTMSTVYRNLGLLHRARALLEDALEIRRDVFEPDHPAIGECLFSLAWVLKDQGFYEAAEKYAVDALRIRRIHLGDENADVAFSKALLGAVRYAMGRSAEAERLLREAIATQQRVLGPKHPDLGITLGKLGDVVADQGRFAEAETIIRRTLAMRRSMFPEGHAHIASALSSLAAVLWDQGRYTEAEPAIRQAIAFRQKELTPRHPYVAAALTWLGRILRCQGRTEEAVQVGREAVDIYRQRRHQQHPDLAVSLTSLGWALLENGALDEASATFTEAIEIDRAQETIDPADLCDALIGYGRILLAKRNAAGAEPYLREAFALIEPFASQKTWLWAKANSALGRCLMDRGALTEAASLLEVGYTRSAEVRGADDRYVRERRRLLARLYDAMGQPERAAEYRK